MSVRKRSLNYLDGIGKTTATPRYLAAPIEEIVLDDLLEQEMRTDSIRHTDKHKSNVATKLKGKENSKSKISKFFV
jgi:hypothetical protein